MPNAETRILLVDDQLHMRRMLRRMLIHLGYKHVDENDGKTVLNTLKLYNYDLIICDWMMEPTSGIEVLAFVRTDDDLKELPFIMLTGESTSQAVLAAVNAGAQGYIAKPVSLQTLGTTVERVLGTSASSDGPPARRAVHG